MPSYDSAADDTAEDSDDEDRNSVKTAGVDAAPPSKPAKRSLGQKVKDKLTGSTHEERVQEREERYAAETRAYQRHIMLRQAMSKAIETGQPQLIGKDKEGRDMYLEPPQAGQGWGGGGNYHQDPNARYVRPNYGYSRPYGRGLGGGIYPYGLGVGGEF